VRQLDFLPARRPYLPQGRMPGLASLIPAESSTIEEVDEFLLLDGMRIICERNR
jgi:hypothetical protein